MAVYLVTGGCGFIGSHLCCALMERGHRVRVLDNLSTGSLANLPADTEVIRGSVTDRSIVAEAMRDVHGCFHLAAVASVEESTRNWFVTHQTNLSGTIAVFETASRGRPKPIPVVYASSAAVYGHSNRLPLRESVPAIPRSPYGADKYACELQGRLAFQLFDTCTIGLRFFNVYGPRQHASSPYSGVISIFCDRILRQSPIDIFGDGKQTRDFIYIKDVIEALIASMHRARGLYDVYNVCTGKATSILEIAHIIGELCGYKPDLNFRPARAGEVAHSQGHPGRMKTKLNTVSSVSLRSGLEETLAWLRS